MIVILLFLEPLLLCRCSAGLDATGTRAIPLTVRDARIRIEVLAAMWALTAYLFFEFSSSSRATCAAAT
jgi:hypothetical protein